MKSMKKIYTLAAGFLLCAGLVSCEMKDEIFGGTESAEKGYLNLGVAVNSSENTVVTRAEGDGVTDDGENTGSAVSADDFPVDITCTTNPDYSRSFASYADLLEENPIELSVGTYTVTAHSNLTLEKKMSVPYYEGTSEAPLTITKGVESEAKVVCKMKNTKIQMKYNSEFLANFDTWTITIDDGTENSNGEGNVLTFTESDKNPAAVYWLIAENKNKITVNITATNMDGETITDSRTLTKPTGGNTEFWTGGDALTITMEGITPDPGNPSGVTGIDISVDVTFDEKEETVPVPVTPGTGEGEDEPSEPGTGGDDDNDNAPSLSGQYLEETLVYNKATGGSFPNVEIGMNIPNGIASVWVKVVSDNSDFSEATAIFGLTEDPDGANLVGNTSLSSLFTLPEANQTSYTFSLGSLGSMLTNFEGNHSFVIKIVDNNGLEATDTLNISITNSSSQGE